MILLQNINLPISTDFSNLISIVAKNLKTAPDNIKSAQLFRKSLDARHKNNIVFCCAFLAEVKKGEAKIISNNKKASLWQPKNYLWPICERKDARPIVVGFGPAGIFAALAFARAGLKPIVIERGRDIDSRTLDVKDFFSGKALNTESNIQFGEGGAGTFSDGKLNTGIKDIRCGAVLNTFYENGANAKILYEAKPHIGTDVLVNVIKNIRNEIIKMGGEIRFSTKLQRLIISGNRLSALEVVSNGKTQVLECDSLVLAIGHSARDTYEMLNALSVSMVRKPFSVGARIEHLQKDINKALYGDFAESSYLPAADYKLAAHLPSNRGVYTFCMCPGGEVVNASSEENMICVNGMSYSARSGANANSAVLVEVMPDDLPGENVLEGVSFQRNIESKAYSPDKSVPFCYVGDLLKVKPSGKNKINPTVKPKVRHADIYDVLPKFVADSIKEALPIFDKKISGFADADAVLTFPETRSSSPVRIIRDETLQSVNVKGLYPCGEGAGYAGGIMSAAVDGLKVAEAVIESINKH